MNPWVATIGLLVLLMAAPIVFRFWRKSVESGTGNAGTDLLPLTGKNLDEMVARGLLTAEEAERVRAKTRLQIKRALEERLAREAAAANPAPPGTTDIPVDPVSLAVAEAKRVSATAAANPAIPAIAPPEVRKRPRLPERLAPLQGRTDAELQDLVQAGFLSDDDLKMLKELGRP